jgi:hypothetical protein
VARPLARAVASSFGVATGAFVAERDDWASAIARARAEGWRWIELTALRGRLESLLRFLDGTPDALDAFERVSLHAPAKTAEAPPDVVGLLEPLRFDVVLHPDVYGSEPACARLGTRALFENMDVTKRFGRGLDDLRDVLDSFPSAGLCLDVAHVWTNDPTLRLGHELLDAVGARLRQLHVSGIDPDGTHRLTTQADLDLYAPLLERCRHVPWLLEAELAEDVT